jgi:hypothetical protein
MPCTLAPSQRALPLLSGLPAGWFAVAPEARFANTYFRPPAMVSAYGLTSGSCDSRWPCASKAFTAAAVPPRYSPYEPSAWICPFAFSFVCRYQRPSSTAMFVRVSWVSARITMR